MSLNISVPFCRAACKEAERKERKAQGELPGEVGGKGAESEPEQGHRVWHGYPIPRTNSERERGVLIREGLTALDGLGREGLPRRPTALRYGDRARCVPPGSRRQTKGTAGTLAPVCVTLRGGLHGGCLALLCGSLALSAVLSVSHFLWPCGLCMSLYVPPSR